MPHPVELRQAALSPFARRVVAALLFSLGLHAAIIGLLRLVPSTATPSAPAVLQVKLLERHVQVQSAPLKPVADQLAVLTAVSKSDVAIKPSASRSQLRNPIPSIPAVTAMPAPEQLPQLDTSPAPPIKSTGLPTVKVPLLTDNTYYTTKEIDVQPRTLQPIAPVYPVSAADRQIQGWVLVKIKLDEAGKVEDVVVSNASPAGVFEQAALDAFTKAGFAPAQKAGRAVKSLVEIKVWFNLN